MAINTELLEQVKQHILEEPRRYDQRTWGKSSVEAPCGTAACIAGWAAHLSGQVELEDLRENESLPVSIRLLARDALGLSVIESNTLFDYPPYCAWPSPFKEALNKAYEDGDKPAAARAAADYIDHIIATGKVTD